MTSNLLDGKVAIVTGSSRSIGAAIVKRLAQDGAKVVVNYHKHDDSAKDIVNAIRSDGGVAIAVKADASTVGGGEVLLNECLHAFGRVDILVLNAGSLINETLDSINDEYFNSVFNLHVKGPLFLARAVAPHLQAGGRIIFVSSIVTKKSTILPNYLMHASSKGAIEQVARTLSQELGSLDITVNTISPGVIDTDGFREGKSAHMLQFIANIHPSKRMGVPDDIAPVIAFLASSNARWINGQNIHINGGMAV